MVCQQSLLEVVHDTNNILVLTFQTKTLATPGIKTECDRCSVQCESPLQLLWHQYESAHLGTECCVCSVVFTRTQSLRRHISSVHDRPQLACPQCPMYFGRMDKLKNHQLKFHGMVLCEVCGAGFTDLKCLKQHMVEH